MIENISKLTRQVGPWPRSALSECYFRNTVTVTICWFSAARRTQIDRWWYDDDAPADRAE